MWVDDARHRDRRRHADEDQQRRHQEAAADAEHAGDESDRQPHPQNEEDVDRHVGDREIDLQRASSGLHGSMRRRAGRGGTGWLVSTNDLSGGNVPDHALG